MIDRKKQPLTFIIRASGEATVENLKKQLKKQISKNDTLLLLDDAVSFEVKLKQGFELACEVNNEYTVFIDGDILLRSNVVKRIRKLTKRLEPTDLGFGLKLWDRFYDQPKFRGFHIYQTKYLQEALAHVPLEMKETRPESFVKDKMKADGKKWRNDITLYIAGLHDFYQKPQDIYYKFLIRSKRSASDIEELKSIFKSKPLDPDYNVALKGLEDGINMEEVVNDKYLYTLNETETVQFRSRKKRSSISVDISIMTKLIRYYKFNSLFWKSL